MHHNYPVIQIPTRLPKGTKTENRKEGSETKELKGRKKEGGKNYLSF